MKYKLVIIHDRHVSTSVCIKMHIIHVMAMYMHVVHACTLHSDKRFVILTTTFAFWVLR